jgi:hypothetical protein
LELHDGTGALTAENLSKAGSSLSYVSPIDSNRRTFWMKGWKIVTENLRKAGWNAAVSQARIPTGDNFGLWPHSAATPDVLLF